MEFLDISEEEADSIIEIFEEKLTRFNDDIDDVNLVYVLLKAHLYIEFELEMLIKNNVPEPQFLKLNSFSQKKNLAFALGLIPSHEEKVIHNINLLRNDLAHNLDFDFTEKIFEEKIKRQFGERTKVRYGQLIGQFTKKYGSGLHAEIRCALSVVWGMILERRILPKRTWKTLKIDE